MLLTTKDNSFTVSGVLCDISGVLKDGGENGEDVAISKSVEAFKRLMESGIPTVLCTNESTCSTEEMSRKLQKIGFPVSAERIISPVSVMKQVCVEFLQFRFAK